MTAVSEQVLIEAALGGQVVSFPTDTVPALAVLPNRAESIFAVKQRSLDKPLILMGATEADLWPFVRSTETELQIWQEVANRHWPGALTLVLPASAAVPSVMNPVDPTTIGIRVPDQAIARRILAQTGPLATTSANLSGEPPLRTMAEIDLKFPQVVTLEWEQSEPNATASGVPSTVAKWIGPGWEILRQGVIQLDSNSEDRGR
ncbi:L-threonylcarbamoyladenylate synthase [Laspinema sp. A4]|uniref:L-threonylcarbamoyladenylate synthase n=1 Tax=Laspinema sp. D2d TaxID=2953686 RepID=UPI0021BB7E82|nr:L-threonylcarbamoyladenylate synthase [Laspinema sp. D2d]MCT7982053.1 L-threonylcarbamoyladenylate synthase [Laspinema sp. D2d]